MPGAAASRCGGLDGGVAWGPARQRNPPTFAHSPPEGTAPLTDYIDPVKASPNHYKMLLENDEVRLLEMTLPSGAQDERHSHPAEMVYFISGGKLRIHLPDGTTADADIPDGGVMEHEAWTHQVENVGQTDVHAIIFERKAPA